MFKRPPVLPLLAAVCLIGAVSQTSYAETDMTLSNKDKAIALLKSIETGDKSAIGYVNADNYIQHNLTAGDGLAGFAELLQALPAGSAKVNTVRALEDGEFVVTHSEYEFFGPKVGFDVYRFEDGLIVEHWDNLIETAAPNPSGRTQTDGPTEIVDLDKTDTNKALVESFVTTILVNGDMDKVANYIDGDNYLQHNPAVADGLSGLGAALKAMAEQGITMVYDRLHKVLGEGNFVLTISEGTFGGQPTSYYDLFRVDEGKIVEHWDVIETIIPEEQRKNANGKFGNLSP